VNPLHVVLPAQILLLSLPFQTTPLAAGEPDLAELTESGIQSKPAAALAGACVRFR